MKYFDVLEKVHQSSCKNKYDYLYGKHIRKLSKILEKDQKLKKCYDSIFVAI